MINYFLLAILAGFFAINMGASGIAPSFAAACGSKVIKARAAVLLFSLFVILGALALGKNVSLTLGKSLLPRDILTPGTALVIIISATISLLIANLLKIPQSTSQVTIGAITGAGIFYNRIYWDTLLIKIIPMWIILPLASYLVTLWIYKNVYPPERAKLHIYEKIIYHEKKLKFTAIAVSCYVAFAIGSNNVANAVGPLFGAGLVGIIEGLLIISPLFGLGAYLLGRGTMETVGREIVPLGIFSCMVVSFVTATLLLIASFLGIPQSLVQLNVCSVLAISSLKNGHYSTLQMHITRKTFFVWAITPVLSVLISYVVLFIKMLYFGN